MRYTKLIKNLILTLTAISIPSFAFAGSDSSWSSQPSWASDAPPPARRSVSQPQRPSNLQPFSPGSNNLALDVGQVFLMGDLGNNYEDSLGGQLHYTYGVSDIFGFDSSLGYSNHSDGKFSMTTLLTGLRTNLSWFDRVVPYAVFGLGFYKPSYEISDTTTLSPVLFGIHMGPGVDLQLTQELFFGAALTFHDMFGETQKLAANSKLDMGGTYTSFLLHAGVTF